MAPSCAQVTLFCEGQGRVAAQRLPCRTWGCADCARGLRWRVQRKVRAGNPDKLITLTVDPSIGGGPDDRAELLVRGFRHIRECAEAAGEIWDARHRRWVPWRGIEWLYVFERTKAGEPHLHIVARSGYLPQQWLSNKARQFGLGYVVDVRRVRSKRGAARYVGKYLAKDVHRFDGRKRYSPSHGFCGPKPPREPPARPAGSQTWARMQSAEGYDAWMRNVVEDHGYTYEPSDDGWDVFLCPGVRPREGPSC